MLKEKKLIPEKLEHDDKIADELEPVNLHEFITAIFTQIENENRSEELSRYKKWAKNRAFYRGNQRGFWDNKKNSWVTIDLDSLPPSDASLLVINNQFRPQVKTLAKEFSRSLTRIRANPKSDSQEAIMASRFSDALIKHYQHKLLKESQRQLEAKYMLLCGNSFRYIYYDKSIKSAKVNVPVKGKINLPSYEANLCVDCGAEAEEYGEGKCPYCDGTLERIEVEGKEIEGRIGYESINAGDLVCEIVDPVEIKVWSGASCLEDSPYIRRKRLVKGNFIKNTYPFFKLPKDAKFSETAVNQWQFFDTSNKSGVSFSDSDLYEYDQLWLEPSFYKGKKLLEDVKFKRIENGEWVDITLDKDTPIEKVFPDGIYVCRVGQDILTYYNESKDKCWIHLPFDINVDGFWADGLEDSIMNQQIINEYTSLSVENVLYNASPKLVLNPHLINPASVTGKPKDAILMSDNARKDAPKDAIFQLQGMSLTQEVMMGIESSKRDMREQTGALLAFNGQGDPNISTATGMSIARDSALALVATPLAIRAEKDLDMAWKILRFVKENWYDNKYRFLLGKFNESEAIAFKRSKIEEEVNLYIEPYSWMPQTNFEKLENLAAYLTAFGLPLGFLNPQIPDVVRTYASQLYNVPLDFDDLYPDKRIAQKRLDIAKEFAEKKIPAVVEQVTQLLAIGQQEVANHELMVTIRVISDLMGVEEDLDDHNVFINEYKRWLKTDEGQNAHPILREAVRQTIADHRQFLEMDMAMQAENNILRNGGQPPILQGGIQPTFQTPESSPFQPQSGVTDFSLNKDNKI